MATDQDLVWFITGCSTGIGRCVAEGLAAAGHRVVATARDTNMVRDLEERFSERVIAQALDLESERSVAAAFAAAVAAFGRVDVAVNNAGQGLVAAVEETLAGDAARMLQVNVIGALHVTKAALAHMRPRRSGYVMTVGSIGGIRGRAGLSLYAATKHALEGVHDALAEEVKTFGIRTTILELGSFRTGFRYRGMRQGSLIIDDYESTVGALRRSLSGDYPERIGDPATIAPLLMKLAAMPHPPLRLAVGADAVEGVRTKAQRLLAELERWQSLSLSAGVQGERAEPA